VNAKTAEIDTRTEQMPFQTQHPARLDAGG
jgi:hypothetical protein